MIRVFKSISIDDGLGGVTNSYKLLQEITDYETAPTTVSFIEAGGREVAHNVLKVFTEEKLIEIEDIVFEYENQRYILASLTDYEEIFLYQLEVI